LGSLLLYSCFANLNVGYETVIDGVIYFDLRRIFTAKFFSGPGGAVQWIIWIM
jgi:hypothetical protein